MDWGEVQRRKKNMMAEVVHQLSEDEKQLLAWLLRKEKLVRHMQRPRVQQDLLDKLTQVIR